MVCVTDYSQQQRRGCAGAVADDFYHRYLQDIAAMKKMNVTAFRMSIAWPRILPYGHGEPNQLGIAFYNRVFDALEVAGITPYVTLYHWDLPQV
jgi:beta-glucosidase/6-phospho-beta-glucosidase/beta-galactosidase